MLILPGIYKWIKRIITAIAAVLLFSFFMLVFINVISRYLFNAPIVIADELCFYMFTYVAVLAVYHAYSHKAHVRVDLLTGQLGERPRAWLRVITSIFEEFLWIIISWRGILFAYDLIARTHSLHTFNLAVPVAVTFMAIPVAALLIVIENLFVSVIPSIQELRNSKQVPKNLFVSGTPNQRHRG